MSTRQDLHETPLVSVTWQFKLLKQPSKHVWLNCQQADRQSSPTSGRARWGANTMPGNIRVGMKCEQIQRKRDGQAERDGETGRNMYRRTGEGTVHSQTREQRNHKYADLTVLKQQSTFGPSKDCGTIPASGRSGMHTRATPC